MIVCSLDGEPATALHNAEEKNETSRTGTGQEKIGDVGQAARNNVKRLTMDNLTI
ncbi:MULTISPECIES: hypothetical protein [unclassified Methanosarcina]|uniref:hypothetical protein n=1 Tax=unclassified Methanosarcina TaxID=2644672 RepID=UPI000A64C553|nr:MULTISPECIES: hypothetical protein [unclassified Methanosarcina]